MFFKNKIIALFLFLSCIIAFLTVSTSAIQSDDEDVSPVYTLYPNSAGYYINDGTIRRYSDWVYDESSENEFPAHLDMTVLTGDIPVTYFMSFGFNPNTLQSGYNYKINVSFDWKPLDDKIFNNPEDVLKLNQLYFANQIGNNVFVMPSDNIVSLYDAKYLAATSARPARISYTCTFFLSVDERINSADLVGRNRFMYIELPAYIVNSSRLQVNVSYLKCESEINQANFNVFVADRISHISSMMGTMDDNLRFGFEKLDSAIADMPAHDYDFAHGKFGLEAQSKADELLDGWSQKFSGVIESASSSITSLYNAISTHDADFCIIMPESKVPIFEDLKIYEKSGLIRLEDLMPAGVYKKFDDVLIVVRGVISVTSIFGLLWWCIPKHLLGGD